MEPDLNREGSFPIDQDPKNPNPQSPSDMASSSVKDRVYSGSKGDLSPTDIQGAVRVALDYDKTFGEFKIYVRQCKNLAETDGSKGRSDPTRLGKRKTSVRKRTVNPSFQEMLKVPVTTVDDRPGPQPAPEAPPRIPPSQQEGGPVTLGGSGTGRTIPPPVVYVRVGHTLLNLLVTALGGGGDEITGTTPQPPVVYEHQPQVLPEYLHGAFAGAGDGRDGVFVQSRLSQALEDNHRRPRLMYARRYRALPENILAALATTVSDGRFREERSGLSASPRCQSHPYGTRGPVVRNANGRPRALPWHQRSPNLPGGFGQDDERAEGVSSAQILPGAL
ncbi:uncharacterized protein LOC130456146 isoform X2 [Monodelphis domestica]|uniref:uncharacterized protein LOC130456146 isoform X2 n=1 Tax=Monodelphis domestica TaxID=13616 RepID=UPI0024E1F031|nr:uncharacterized protein LOC130456146 isoform X2 [Monodelphis domestica]XP_056665373.1 uncharacterized protein LOC130456146 isoform X2 [Monodelphis domestica]